VYSAEVKQQVWTLSGEQCSWPVARSRHCDPPARTLTQNNEMSTQTHKTAASARPRTTPRRINGNRLARSACG